MRRIITILWILLVSGAVMQASASGTHTSTEWEIQPSLKYDALCLLNVLSGDPYYMEYYKAEYEQLHPLFTPEENNAFVQLKKIIKDDNGGIISAGLALYFSAVPDETLDEMIRTAHDSSKMREALKRTPYWSNEEWAAYEQARPFLETALRALRRVGFEKFWRENARPKVEKRIAEIEKDLPRHNIVPAIESKLGKPLASDHITIYLLAYSEPHGIRITGTRFLTHYSYPFGIVLHNAIHEMMHPPFDANSPAMTKVFDRFASDPTIQNIMKNHDRSFGYNDVPGYVEEDSVQALEQIVSEEFGAGRDAREYWKEQDGGMHVLAVAIYLEYKPVAAKMPYQQWLEQSVATGKLQGDDLKQTTATFLGSKQGSVR